MSPESIQRLIEQALPGAQARVESEDGVHFQAHVVAAQFEGKRPLERHRMVYAALGDRVGGEIHALQLKTQTPAEAGR
jgi:acid stress-induced BolA-like protein IbaG/YrbA